MGLAPEPSQQVKTPLDVSRARSRKRDAAGGRGARSEVDKKRISAK
jgi:hypothetical protein